MQDSTFSGVSHTPEPLQARNQSIPSHYIFLTKAILVKPLIIDKSVLKYKVIKFKININNVENAHVTTS